MLDFEMIVRASEVLKGVTSVTPLLESQLLNDRLGFRLLVKAECLQRTGSFKIRGAYVKVASLGEFARRTGVVAFSSGNHAQGVAAAAKQLGVASTIVMPSDAPAIKLRNTAEYGAKVVEYDRLSADRAKIARDISEDTGAVLVPPYDDHVLMSGQGTVGLEIAKQLSDLGVVADALICPVGGGGLLSGIATAMAEVSPRTHICAAEPEHFDDTRRSLSRGERVENALGHTSICDSIVTMKPGELTFPILKQNVTQAFAASDEETISAMRVLAGEFKLVVEPGGAVGAAVALRDRHLWAGKTVVVVVSGGNVDLELWNRMTAVVRPS